VCSERTRTPDADFCMQVIVANLREQHELAKLLDGGPLRQVTMTLLECSLHSYRVASERRRNGHRPDFLPA